MPASNAPARTEVTLAELVDAVASVTDDRSELIEAVAHMLRSSATRSLCLPRPGEERTE